MGEKKYIWDLETAPIADELLVKFKPEFQPDSRLVDPVKIKASIESKETEWKDRAALSGITGRIIAYAGVWDNEEPEVAADENESVLLKRIVEHLQKVLFQGGKAYCFNGFHFDLPVLCMRCAINKIPVYRLFQSYFRGRWSWNESFIDVLSVWVGPYQPVTGHSLKNVALALGVGEKTGNGKDFADLLKTDRDRAIEYAKNDVVLLRKIVAAMGI
jgi:DNA polymerase elongation subunit (family B)